MSFSDKFFKTTAVCAFIGGVLIVVLWLMSFGFKAPTDIDSAMALTGNNMASAYLWIGAITLFFSIVSMWGIAAKKIGAAAGLATTGFLFMFADFVMELISYGIILFPWNTAAEAYAAADDASKAIMKTNVLAGLYGLSWGIMVFGMFCVIIGFVLFGLATWKGKGIEKLVSIFFFLSVIAMVLYGFMPAITIELLANLITWLCPLIYAAAYLLVGAWLWKGTK
jgi:hypothetical protein